MYCMQGFEVLALQKAPAPIRASLPLVVVVEPGGIDLGSVVVAHTHPVNGEGVQILAIELIILQ